MIPEGAAPPAPDAESLSPEEVRRALHELRVHQIELEQQNEELRRVQAELDASRVAYVELYDLAPVGYVTLSERGLVLEANLTVTSLLRVGRGDLVKQPFSRFVFTDDSDIYYLNSRRLFASREPQAYDVRMGAGTGLWWAHIDATVSQDAAGAPVCRMALSDITDRKRAEAALLREAELLEAVQNETAQRESYELLSLFVRHSPMFAYIKAVTPAENRVLHASDHFQRLTGFLGSDMVGKTLEELFPADMAARIAADDLAVVSGRHVLTRDEEFGGRSYTTMKFPIVQGDKTLLAGYTVDVTERKRTEEALRESEAHLAVAMDQAHLARWEMDAATSIFTFNDRFYALYGTTAEREGGYQMTAEVYTKEFVLPDEQPLISGDIARLLTDEIVDFQREHRIRRRDGNIRSIIVRVAQLRDATGRIVGTRGSNQDITERKRVEEALRLTRFSIECASDPVFWIASDGHIVDVNEAACRSLGYTRQELLGLCVPDIDAAHGAEIWPGHFAELRQRGTMTFESKHRHRDGRLIPVEVVTNYVKFGDEERNCAFVRDITERKRAEYALRESEARLNLALRSASMGVWQWDIAADMRRFDDQVCHFLGLNPATFSGTSAEFQLAVHPDDRDTLKAAWARTLGQGEPYCPEYRAVWPDGSIHHISARGQLSRDEAGRPLRVDGIIWDITERKRAEEEKARLETELQQAQKMESIGRLAGGVAHDFNNMLGVILGHTELAMDQVDATQPLHADLEEIRKAATRSAHLTCQLLAFARKQTVSPRVLDLNDTVAGTLNMLGRLIGEDIRLTWQPGANVWPVKIDPAQVDQILANLCVNARDAIAGVGTITVSTANAVDDADWTGVAGVVPGEHVRVTVSDTGCGMDAETLSHLFEPFFTTKGVGAGTGMGLASVCGAVEQNGGVIQVRSEPGAGTTFRIYLPRHVGQVAQAQAGGPTGLAARGHETILLVEDEPAILSMTTTMLERQGYTVLVASTPGDAIRLATEHAVHIHLLMTDVVMPEMSGGDLSKQLQSIHPHIKRLFMSGYTADVIADHGVVDERVSFIQKPFSIRNLAAMVREALDRE